MGHEKPVDCAVEDDYFELLVSFDRGDDLVQLRNRFRPEDIYRRMIQRDAPMRGRMFS